MVPIASIIYQSEYAFSNALETKETYFFEKKKNDYKSYLISFIPGRSLGKFISIIQNENLSKEIKLNAIHLIEKLPESLLLNLSVDSIFKSKYNTLIVDFEEGTKNLTIDIGSKTFGYFIENNGEIVALHEELTISDKKVRVSSLEILNKSILNYIL